MKKIAVLATAVGIGLSAMVPAARAGNGSAASESDRDFAVGGTQHVGIINEGFSAHSGPAGEDPSGHVSSTTPQPSGQPLELKGPVICLHVLGNRAFIRYVAEKSDVPGFPQGGEVVLHVIDNGEPRGGMSPDLMANIPGAFAPRIPGFPCGFNPFAVPVTNGNIVVNDA